MTDLSARPVPAAHHAERRLRFVTAASLFDGHDASINIIRRMLQASGAEVIHLGHNRSVDEIVTAALQEDVARHRAELLSGRPRRVLQVHARPAARARRREHQGVRRRRRRHRARGDRELHAYGVTRIYSPEDGATMGLQGMIDDMISKADSDLCAQAAA